jgi:hypothetical protein
MHNHNKVYPNKLIKFHVLILEGDSQAITGDRTETRVKMNRMRLRIAERLKEAQNTNAMLTTFNEIDLLLVSSYFILIKTFLFKQCDANAKEISGSVHEETRRQTWSNVPICSGIGHCSEGIARCQCR